MRARRDVQSRLEPLDRPLAQDGIRIWDVGLDARSLEEWRQIAARVPFPQIPRVLGVSPAP